MPSYSYLVMGVQVVLPLLAAALTVTVGRAMRGRGVSEWTFSWYALPPSARSIFRLAARSRWPSTLPRGFWRIRVAPCRYASLSS